MAFYVASIYVFFLGAAICKVMWSRLILLFFSYFLILISDFLLL
jgi:hypothetical protein